MKDKRPFFAIALERKKGNSWIPEIEHMRANDAREAEITFRVTEKPGTYRIVGVAQVIGYKLLDKKGDLLAL